MKPARHVIGAIGFLFSATLLSLACHAQDFSWKDEDGNAVPDAPNQKAKDGFGALLLITEDESIFERWNTPEQPKISTVDDVRRGVPIHVIVVFAGPRTNERGHAHVTYNARVLTPDGSVYGEFKDIEAVKGPAAPGLSLNLAPASVGIVIEPQDPAGTYTVEIEITDRVRKTTLKLSNSFNVAK